MTKGTVRLVIAAVGLFGMAACSSSTSQPHAATGSSIPDTPTATATAAPTTSTSCAGLSTCNAPPPDTEGNRACYYRDGWAADPSGAGISVYYFRESSDAANSLEVTADVHLKDGSTASQIAVIDPGESSDQIQFPGIDSSSVQEVLLTTSAGQCVVTGSNGS